MPIWSYEQIGWIGCELESIDGGFVDKLNFRDFGVIRSITARI